MNSWLLERILKNSKSFCGRIGLSPHALPLIPLELCRELYIISHHPHRGVQVPHHAACKAGNLRKKSCILFCE